MSSSAVQALNARVAQSAELQAQLRSLQSPVELIRFAKAQGIELTGEDLQAIAQAAFQAWISQLQGPVQAFFQTAQATPELNQQVKQCKTPEEAIALGQRYGFEFTTADLQEAATVAHQIEGFSFEKLWFIGLGIR